MPRKNNLIILILVSLILISCVPSKSPALSTATVAPDTDVLYVNLLWHQHQPLYYKDAEGVYTRPWVRVHATKDYYDMASTVAKYPDVHVTFNLTPVLIRQLDDFSENNAKDQYWVLSEVPASQLTQDQKTFILSRFFDANWDNIIKRFPRYQELLNLRGGADAESIKGALTSYSEQDFRDLQIWFNLAWFDPEFLGKEPLLSLVNKGSNFSEEDKLIVFSQVQEVIKQIIPLHKKLQQTGQIEVITTPYAHPILPLIYNSDLAEFGNSSTDLPERFSYPNDVIAHLERSVQVYEDHFGVKPRGLWPGEGSVAQDVVSLISLSGYEWMATGEPVLSASLGLGSFTRNAQETVLEADILYRPYYVKGNKGENVAVFFRDWALSDKLGFTYSQTKGKEAAKDLMKRLELIRQQLQNEKAVGPHIVSIVLDGENAWEYYPNDGKEFLNAMYQEFSESKTLKTITPSEYLKLFPDQKSLDNLFPGAWFSANYDTWIGEKEENQAWEYLAKTREALAKYDMTKKRTATPEAIAKAQDFMYLAEGSDWFWWYGADQDSGQDSYFDTAFRELLGNVYKSLGEEVPAFLNVPIIPALPETPQQYLSEPSTPIIDGKEDEGEWGLAAEYTAKDTRSLSIAQDKTNLYLKIETNSQSSLGVYISTPKAKLSNPFLLSQDNPTRVSGVQAAYVFQISGGGIKSYESAKEGWSIFDCSADVMGGQGLIEVSIPLENLGELESGDDLLISVIDEKNTQTLPASGPAKITLLDMGNYIPVLQVNDPAGDDHGPGGYTYPTDPLFVPGVFDLANFSVSYNDKNLVFAFQLFGPVPNPWGSPLNLSLQTLDVYIDKDPSGGTGARKLLPGRNASFNPSDGWEFAVWAEGWYSAIAAPDANNVEPKKLNDTGMKIIVDVAKNTVTIRVPRSVFGEGDPEKWGYAAAVMSQDGFPSTGVWRIRDIQESAEQWRLGGAPADSNHTRIIDLAWPVSAEPSQESMLSGYASLQADIGNLLADDLPQIRLLTK